MIPVTITETCSCGAMIEVTGSRYRNDHDRRNPRGAEEVAERWRTDHVHVEPKAPTAPWKPYRGAP